MKLLSLNVALFEKNNAKLKDFLEKQNPDVVCLQEVTRRVGKDVELGYVSHEVIEASTPSLTNSFYGPMWIMKDFRQSDFHGQKEFIIDFGDWLEFGLMTRTRYSVYGGRMEFVQGTPVIRTDWSDWPDTDNRAVQVTDLMIESEKPNLRLLNYHGIWSRGKAGNEKTAEVANKILTMIREVDYPVIVCGDFNLFPKTGSMKILSKELESLVDTHSIVTTRPQTNELSQRARNVVDYILVSKGIRVNSFSVPESDVSDHLPLILDFDLG
jgi:endonuclease/exonuclease/phosphatase family metal-dependent hydrolase